MAQNPGYSGIFFSIQDNSVISAYQALGNACVVFTSSQGPTNVPQFITTTKQWKGTFGKHNPQVTFASYCACDALTAGGAVWGLRVVHSDCTYPILAYTSTNTLVSQTAVNQLSSVSLASSASFLIAPLGQGTYAQSYTIGVGGPVTAEQVSNNSFNIYVYSSSSLTIPLETWNVSKILTQLNGMGQNMYITNIINGSSSYIQIIDNISVSTAPLTINQAQVQAAFSGASNGSAVTDADIVNGWSVFNDYITYPAAILMNGGWTTPAVQLAMNEVASSRQTCMSFLDMPFGSTATISALEYRNVTLNAESYWGCIFSPWYLRLDEDNSIQVYAPPSGAAAAAYITNFNKNYPWIASAGVINGNIPNALGLSQSYLPLDRAMLEPAQINPIISEPGFGICIVNEKTLQGYTSWLSYTHVIFLTIELIEQFRIFFKPLQFQPIDQLLFNKVVSGCNQSLQAIQTQQGLSAYQVTCSFANNTPYTQEQNQLMVDIQLVPVGAAAEVMVTLTFDTSLGSLSASVAG